MTTGFAPYQGARCPACGMHGEHAITCSDDPDSNEGTTMTAQGYLVTYRDARNRKRTRVYASWDDAACAAERYAYRYQGTTWISFAPLPGESSAPLGEFTYSGGVAYYTKA